MADSFYDFIKPEEFFVCLCIKHFNAETTLIISKLLSSVLISQELLFLPLSELYVDGVS